MKIALVHDHITCKAGGEQVLLAFHKAFPEAPIFTLAYDKQESFPEFQNCDIKTSWFQHISYKTDLVKNLFFPLGIIASSMIDVSSYNIVLMSTTHCAKYVKVSKKATVFCYSHNPFRLAWYSEYYESNNTLKKFFFPFIIPILKYIDKKSTKKISYLLTNSTTVAHRLREKYEYKKDIHIFPPPVNIDNFYITNTAKHYFLVVSRLEEYKRIDIVINLFNELHFPLIVVGKGPLKKTLQNMANENISFLEDLSKSDLARIYSYAKCLIFPQLEDFGITPLEANASGIPVIAYNKGGVLDSQKPYKGDPSTCTSIFFNEQNTKSLGHAINVFLELEQEFNPVFIRKNAEEFQEARFIEKISKFIIENAP